MLFIAMHLDIYYIANRPRQLSDLSLTLLLRFLEALADLPKRPTGGCNHPWGNTMKMGNKSQLGKTEIF